MPGIGGYIVAFCAFLFGYTTLIGWAYYGEQFFEYLLGRPVAHWYRWIYCLLIPFGAVSRVDVVWAWGDLMNALQIFPNLIGVLALSGLVAMYVGWRIVFLGLLPLYGLHDVLLIYRNWQQFGYERRGPLARVQHPDRGRVHQQVEEREKRRGQQPPQPWN